MIWHERDAITYHDGIQPRRVALTVWHAPAGHAAACECYACSYARRETCGNGEAAVTCCLSCGRPFPRLSVHCPICYWPPVPLTWRAWAIRVPLPLLRAETGRGP